MTFQHFFERVQMKQPAVTVPMARLLLVETLEAISMDVGAPRVVVAVEGDGLYELPSEGRAVLTPPRDARRAPVHNTSTEAYYGAVFALYAEGDDDPTDPGNPLAGPRLYVTDAPVDSDAADVAFRVVVECYPEDCPAADSDDLPAWEVPFGEAPLLRVLAEFALDPLDKRLYWQRFLNAQLRLKSEARKHVNPRTDGVSTPDFTPTPDTDF